ncbi:Tigger transposable element-derived protein 6 [Araneus ventricosus]|uniref:Tigger transposable element-derived protein 6 n=1 Tax=Araneus ventricosus TaxID=182803 RepID=A0A4Y2QDT2_ARAVE|nr:Tigger transposable element-derived protein 6 [Araneus ventricosus]
MPGGKKSKERLTVLLCCNADGSEKFPPLAIGRSKKPRCFKNVKKLPCDYTSNKTAWMTSHIFLDFLHKFDRKMEKEKRKVLLLWISVLLTDKIFQQHESCVFSLRIARGRFNFWI